MVSTFASIDPRLLASMARRAMFLGLRNQPWQMDCQGQHAISFKKSCMLNNVNLRWKRHAPWFAATRGIYWAHTVLHPRTVFLLIASVANGLSMHAIKEPPSHSLIADDGPQHFRSGFSHVLAIHDLKYFEKKRPVQQIPIWVQAWQDYDRPIGFNECHNRNMWPCFRRSSLRRLWFRGQPWVPGLEVMIVLWCGNRRGNIIAPVVTIGFNTFAWSSFGWWLGGTPISGNPYIMRI